MKGKRDRNKGNVSGTGKVPPASACQGRDASTGEGLDCLRHLGEQRTKMVPWGSLTCTQNPGKFEVLVIKCPEYCEGTDFTLITLQ